MITFTIEYLAWWSTRRLRTNADAPYLAILQVRQVDLKAITEVDALEAAAGNRTTIWLFAAR